jgi:hypothetical protein
MHSEIIKICQLLVANKLLIYIFRYVKTKNSQFTSSVKVVYLDESDEQYEKVSKLFKIHGYAFLANSVIFMDVESLKKDGWWKKEYLRFIESHEIAHKVLKHRDGKRSKVQEAQADYLGVKLCQDKDFDAAAKVGIKHFAGRNSFSFEKYEAKYGKKILNAIK